MRQAKPGIFEEWLTGHWEDWLGLTINREKTSVVRLHRSESLDFLGYTFRFDRDLRGRGHRYLNVQPSKKSLAKAREAVRDLGHYARGRMISHLNRRSQRKYHRPKGMSHSQDLQHLGLLCP